jgi:hypothetical protein
MQAKEVLKSSADMSMMVFNNYLSDLSDADLMLRPGVGCNHLAWQIGHLIKSETDMLNAIRPGAAPELPVGFAEKHTNETKDIDDPASFCTKQEYMDLLSRVRTASAQVLESMSPSDLDQPAPEQFRQWFPTVGSVYLLIANHPLMHAGQFVPVRRALGKPVLM